jgi:hypothetical protein
MHVKEDRPCIFDFPGIFGKDERLIFIGKLARFKAALKAVSSQSAFFWISAAFIASFGSDRNARNSGKLACAAF